MTDIEYYDDATYYGVGFTEGDMTNCKDGDLWAKPIMQENGCEVGILHVMKDGEWVPVESENERKHKDEIAAAYALGVEARKAWARSGRPPPSTPRSRRLARRLRTRLRDELRFRSRKKTY